MVTERLDIKLREAGTGDLAGFYAWVRVRPVSLAAGFWAEMDECGTLDNNPAMETNKNPSLPPNMVVPARRYSEDSSIRFSA